MVSDPFEFRNIAAREPEVVARMLAGYDAWFADVSARGYEPPRIVRSGRTTTPRP